MVVGGEGVAFAERVGRCVAVRSANEPRRGAPPVPGAQARVVNVYRACICGLSKEVGAMMIRSAGSRAAGICVPALLAALVAGPAAAQQGGAGLPPVNL